MNLVLLSHRPYSVGSKEFLIVKNSSPISTGIWHHNACNAQSAKTPFLCTTAIAKSNSEDNPVQGIMAIGAVVNFQGDK